MREDRFTEIKQSPRQASVEDVEYLCDEVELLSARLDAALKVCRSALRVLDSRSYQGVSDEDCDLETSVRNWQRTPR